MIQSEIEQQLNKEYDAFLHSSYKGDIPDSLMSFFEKAIMVLPPQSHQVNFHKIKAILDKQTNELTVSDLNDIIKLVYNVSLERYYEDLYEAIPEFIKIERFVIKFNAAVKDFSQKMNMKRQSLSNLSSGILNRNGMKAIPPNGSY